MTMKTTEFVKNENRITVKQGGTDYSLETGRVYNLKMDRFTGPVLEADGTLELPEKLYVTDKDKTFVKRVTNFFDKYCDNNLGVLLSGLKGSGKTLMSKQIAVEANLPIIVVDPCFPANQLNNFFLKFNQSVVVLFDEIEKNDYYWETDDLLPFLDGIQKSGKRLIIMTCNTDDKLSEYLKDRCGRIRYVKNFKGISDEMVMNIVKDFIDDNDDYVNKLSSYIIDNVKVRSFDNIIALCKEIQIEGYPEDIDDVIECMNIAKL